VSDSAVVYESIEVIQQLSIRDAITETVIKFQDVAIIE